MSNLKAFVSPAPNSPSMPNFCRVLFVRQERVYSEYILLLEISFHFSACFVELKIRISVSLFKSFSENFCSHLSKKLC